MGQYWTIFNMSKGVTVGSFGDFPEIFLSGSEAADIVQLISSTGAKFPEDPLEGQPYKEARKFKSDKTGLCDLPTELHNAIFAERYDPVDIFAFSLAASHFWRIGIQHFKVLYTRYFRRAHDWSRARLICLGDGSDGCPEGLIDEELVEELEEAYLDLFGDEGVGIYYLLSQFSERNTKAKWPGAWDFRKRCALKKPNIPLVVQKYINTGSTYGWERDAYLPAYKYDFSAWFDLPDLPRCHNLERPCVLRNRSKKVYVRDDALLLTKEDANEGDGEDANEEDNVGAQDEDDEPYEDDEDEDENESKDAKPCYMSFGSLVILRIAWFTDLSLGTPYDDDLCRGIWAGDRFDIVSLDVVEKEEGWTDVSTAAREQLIQVWKAVFGRQWQAEVRKSRL